MLINHSLHHKDSQLSLMRIVIVTMRMNDGAYQTQKSTLKCLIQKILTDFNTTRMNFSMKMVRNLLNQKAEQRIERLETKKQRLTRKARNN